MLDRLPARSRLRQRSRHPRDGPARQAALTSPTPAQFSAGFRVASLGLVGTPNAAPGLILSRDISIRIMERANEQTGTTRHLCRLLAVGLRADLGGYR
jgi:hypothetical protein